MIINLTPHAIDIYDEDAPDYLKTTDHALHPVKLSLPPSGAIARIAEDVVSVYPPHLYLGAEDVLDVANVVEVRYGRLEGLPAAHPGRWHVVSLACALASLRRDLLIPWRQVRNSSATVIGCRGLARVQR